MKKEREKVEETTKCPECGSVSIKRDSVRGEIFCEDCGLVISENLIDYGPEWQAFDKEQQDKRARSGPPADPFLPSKGLSTEIGYRDSHGKQLSMKTSMKMYRLRKWQRRLTYGGREVNLSAALSEITRMTSKLGLPRDVRETAGMIFRKITTGNLLRGRAMTEIASAVLYAACRQCNTPRTLDEIADASGLSRKKIGRAYRFISKELGLKLMPTPPSDYISRFCNKLELSKGVCNKAIEILKEADGKDLIGGKSPVGSAAASIYIATVFCGKRKTQREVADAAGISEVTIRSRYKKIIEGLGVDSDLFLQKVADRTHF